MYLRPDSQSVYDVAQVCLNGHVTNGFSRSSPEFNETFCSNSGERTITVCPTCKHAIRGQIAGSMIVSFPAPRFCHNCGEAYTWTARSLTAARELAEELENLGTEEKQILSALKRSKFYLRASMILCAIPRKLLLLWFDSKTFMRKAGGLAAEQLKSTLREIATESVKRALFPGV